MYSKETFQQLYTVRDFIRYAMSCFHQAEIYYGHGTDNAWDEAVHLVLASLYLPWDAKPEILDARLTEIERSRLGENIRKRVEERLPIPYITGEAWFMGLPFKVNETVLIPRSPIAEMLQNELQPWLGDVHVKRILDLCSGSGCIGIAAGYVFEEAEVVLADISLEAVSVAAQNIGRHHMDNRVTAVKSDLFSGIADIADIDGKFDVILTNPPYVDAEDMADLPAEFRHEPRLALESGEDGLDLTRRILAQSGDYLNPGGILICEVGNSLGALSESYGEVTFLFPEFEHGGQGVFVLSEEELKHHRCLFESGISTV